jgi:hypothetical protein
MTSINGLKNIAATSIQNSGEIYLGNDIDPGIAGEALVSGGPNQPARWDTHTGTIQPLTIGTNLSLASGNATFNGGTADTLNATDTNTQLNLTAALPVVINNGGGLNREVELQYDTNTLGAGGGALEVKKVPNTLIKGTNVTFSSGTTYDGSSAITIGATDTNTQLNLTAALPVVINNGGGLNREVELQYDTNTLGAGGGALEVKKVPNTLTAGTNISFSSGTTYDGSAAITISSTDTDTTYTGGKNITVDTTPNPDEIDLDDDLTGIDTITMTSTAGSTALTGNDYPSNPTPMTYFDLSSATNVFPKFSPATAAGVGGLGGIYRDVANGFLYRFLLPSDFLNDNDSSGYARTVIADSFNHGAQQCYAGSQYYAFFTIPDGYYFSGFRVNLVNSAGTPQGTTPTSSFYVNVYTKTINSNLSVVGTTKGFNTDNLGYTITSGYGAGWDINDPITIGAIHCFRNPWSSSFYNRGGWIQYTEGSPGGGGGGM